MSYFAGHMKKLKRADLRWAQIHNQREKESKTNRDIDKSRTMQNYDLANGGKVNYQQKIDDRLKEGLKPKARVRKDSVLCNSWVITSDKGFFDRIGEQEEKRFFKEAYQWFADRYGKENIAYAVVHKDEHTPHMHLGVIPITPDGRLSSKELFNRQQLKQIQDQFPKFIQSRGFDLKRGIPGKGEHLEPQRWKVQQLAKQEQEIKQRAVKVKQFLDKGIPVVKGLVAKKQQLEQELKPLFGLQEKARNVHGMEVESVFLDKDRVKVKKEDWEGLKRQALYTARLQGDADRLSQENQQLHGHIQRMGNQLQEMRQEVTELREVAKDHKELEKYVESLELKLDLIEQELELEFDLEFDELELEDDEMSPKRKRGRRRSPRLTKRKRPKDRPLGRHQRMRRQQRPEKTPKRNHGKIIDRGRY